LLLILSSRENKNSIDNPEDTQSPQYKSKIRVFPKMKITSMTFSCIRRFGYGVAILVTLPVQQQQQRRPFYSCHALSTPSPQQGPYGRTTKNVATQILQGAGPPEVDLNKYNLESLEQIEEEWTANLVQKAAEKEINLSLGVKSEETLFVDKVIVTYPRLETNPGLGIALVELAGGREDGLGITLISGLVSGGPADYNDDGYGGLDILPGDSISKVSIIRKKKNMGGQIVTESEEEFTAKTECLSYDATVDAIRSLPPPSSSHDEYYVLELKRLRRKPIITVNLQYPPSQNEPNTKLELFAGENLRQGMLVRGVKLNDPLAQRFDTKNGGNCGPGGLCRTCVVTIVRGSELLNPQRVAEQQMLEDTPRWRLACKAIVGYGMRDGEMTVRVNPRQWD